MAAQKGSLESELEKCRNNAGSTTTTTTTTTITTEGTTTTTDKNGSAGDNGGKPPPQRITANYRKDSFSDFNAWKSTTVGHQNSVDEVDLSNGEAPPTSIDDPSFIVHRKPLLARFLSN